MHDFTSIPALLQDVSNMSDLESMIDLESVSAEIIRNVQATPIQSEHVTSQPHIEVTNAGIQSLTDSGIEHSAELIRNVPATPMQSVDATTTEVTTPGIQSLTDSGIGSSCASAGIQDNNSAQFANVEEDSDGWEDCSDDDDDDDDEDYNPLWDEEVGSDMESIVSECCEFANDCQVESDIEEAILSDNDEAIQSHYLPDKVTIPGCSLIWDNVQKQSQARHQAQSKSKMITKANALAAEHRVPASVSSDHVIDAHDIPLDTYLKKDTDGDIFFEYADSEVEKIMVRNIPHFKSYRDVVTWHVPHQHSEEMAKKSKVVSP